MPSYCSCDENLEEDTSFLVKFMYFDMQGIQYFVFIFFHKDSTDKFLKKIFQNSLFYNISKIYNITQSLIGEKLTSYLKFLKLLDCSTPGERFSAVQFFLLCWKMLLFNVGRGALFLLNVFGITQVFFFIILRSILPII